MIKGVWKGQSSGANIVSFNDSAFESYGKAKGKNASIGEEASFAYTTALNHLLRKGSRQRIQVGDASSVFWADKPNPFEDDFESRPGGSVALRYAARKTLITAYQERKQDELKHPLLEEHVPIGLLPQVQARLLARTLRGDLEGYLPYLHRNSETSRPWTSKAR